MTLAERLHVAQSKLAQIEAEKRQMAEQAMAIDIALVKLTGAIDLLQELIKEDANGK